MLLSEQHRLPVVLLEPNQEARLDAVNIVKDRRVHVTYRWREGGIDHSLYLVLNSPTLVPEDIEASILLEPLSLST